MPCRTAFLLECDFPSLVVGPGENFELARLAARTASVTVFLWCISRLLRNYKIRGICSRPVSLIRGFQRDDNPPGPAPYKQFHFPDFKNSLRENQDAFATILLKFEASPCNQCLGYWSPKRNRPSFPIRLLLCTVTARFVNEWK